jgi:phosphoglycolate phosphatase
VKRYRLIVWDFDGTLVDTFSLALATYNDLAKKHGFRRVEDPAVVRRLSTRAFLKQHQIPLTRLPLLRREYLAAQKSQITKVRFVPGVPDVLRALHAQGIRQGILSSNGADPIAACLSANALADVFAFVVSYRFLFGKAKAIRRLLRTEGVAREQFLYVGDEVRDLAAAHKAGVDSAAVTWGFHEADLLTRQRPTYLLARPEQMLSIDG